MVTEKDTSWSEADDALLAPFLDAGRAAPGLSDDLTARILAGARESLASGGAPVPAADAAPGAALAGRGFFAGLVAALGGWPAMSGMAVATAAGVWLGFASPSLVDTAGLFDSDYGLSDLMPSAVLAAADAGGQ